MNSTDESIKTTELTQEEILKLDDQFSRVLQNSTGMISPTDYHRINQAFILLKDSINALRFSDQKPYINYPLGITSIVSSEIGLGTSAIICSLLYIPYVSGKLTREQIAAGFSDLELDILDGLYKYRSVTTDKAVQQADNFRKLLISIARDVRVILISIAERLYILRNINDFEYIVINSFCEETVSLYGPMAHRLGLYNIKSEFEDLGIKYTKPEIFNEINRKLSESQEIRKSYIDKFLYPVRLELDKRKVSYEIKWRTKSIHSIWTKMQKQKIEFEEVYDLFAIRIILSSEIEKEKEECWKVYSIVTDIYPPNPERLRDWISIPKSNGYESLHTTVMGPLGKWVEIQIRTVRMNEIAELGLAAHWKYKSGNESAEFDQQWLVNLRELLENNDVNSSEFMNYFSLDMGSKEIFVFTPGGDLKKLPKGATALDFAFEIHSDIGAKCLGTKVNHKVVPLKYQLQNGDQVEIITGKNQKPAQDWLNIVVTSRAKARIRKLLDEEKHQLAENGRETLHRKLKNWKLNIDDSITKLLNHYKLKTAYDLYSQIYEEKILITEIKEILTEKPVSNKSEQLSQITDKEILEHSDNKKDNYDYIKLDNQLYNINYTFAKCCSPIYGDDVFGFVRVGKGISIHRKNCPNALRMIQKYNYRIMKVDWGGTSGNSSFQAIIKIIGIDKLGMINSISNIISAELKMNMRSFTISTKNGNFEGTIKVYVNGQSQLQILLRKLMEVKGITKAVRME